MTMRAWSCLLLLTSGCAHSSVPPSGTAPSDYLLGVDDVVEVSVWKEPALSASLPVRPDGKISLPMVGEVMAAQRTTRDLQVEIRDRLRPYVSEPTVSVMVKEVHAPRFFVLGEVARPGAYPLAGELSVIQALAIAGGPTEFARRGRMLLIRPSAGSLARYRLDYDDVVRGRLQAIALRPGDTIFVP